MNKTPTTKETQLLHAGRTSEAHFGAVNTPVYHASTMLYPSLAAFRGKAPQRFGYARGGTPTSQSLEEAICVLENAAEAVLLPSGVAAVNLCFMHVCQAGDHVLIVDTAYLPTHSFCEHVLKKFDIEIEYYAPRQSLEAVEAKIKPNTKLIFAESPGSLTFELQDIPALAKLAKKHDVFLAVDNTFSAGHLFKPLDHGADFSIQSGTKYISGHADCLFGLVATNEKHANQLRRTHKLFGQSIGPDDAFLALRGLRSLATRLHHHETSGNEIAHWINSLPFISKVLHLGLESHPDHELWKRDFSGTNGLFGFIMPSIDDEKLANMLDHMEILGMGFSFGGYESLLIPAEPKRMVSPWTEPGQLMRLHVGLESVEDIKHDLARGFERAGFTV